MGRRNLRRAAQTPSLGLLEKMRSRLGIQLSAQELMYISDAVRKRDRPNVLVYGTGNDSEYWFRLNPFGTTQFLEDDQHWVSQAARVVPHLAIDSITYGTIISDWQSLMDDEATLSANIPEVAQNATWDVILVDAPRGHEDGNPGRMKSIYQASILAKPGTDVFVHDCNREVEAAYCDRFLKATRFQIQIDRLRHYTF